MAGPTLIQANYDALLLMADRFDQMARSVEESLLKLYQVLDDVRSGGWTGDSANAYLNHTEQVLIPSIHTLLQRLGETGQLLRRIVNILQDAEETAAAQLWPAANGMPAWRDMSLAPYQDGPVPLYMLDLDNPNFDATQFVRNLDTQGRPVLFLTHGYTVQDDKAHQGYAHAARWYSEAYGSLEEAKRPVIVGVDWDAANPKWGEAAAYGAALNAPEGPVGMVLGATAGTVGEGIHSYTEANINAISTGQRFGKLVEEYNRRYPQSPVNVVAHSLGNRLVMEGIASSDAYINNYLAVQPAVDRDSVLLDGSYAAVLNPERVSRIGITHTPNDIALWMHLMTPGQGIALGNDPFTLSYQKAGSQLYPMEQFDSFLELNHYNYDASEVREIVKDFFGMDGKGFQ